MKQVFRAHRLCKQDGPLGPYIDSYAAEMRGEGYARQTREVQIRLVADFGSWLAKRGILEQEITPELFPPYLRARARRRRPTRNDLSALQRLWDLLVRQGVVSPPVSPVATPAERLQSEFRLYLQQERALASTTQNCYLTFVSDFLTERFGTGRVDLSGLCAADVTGFVRRRAVTIRSKRVQLMTAALRSFLRFARYRGDIDKDLAAVAISNGRLLSLEEGRVRFRWRDSQDNNQIKEMSLDAVEFIRRFLLHVLPGGFVKIRHFGFLSNRNRQTMVQRCRELLPASAPLPVVTERPEPVCPVCGVGHLHVIEPRSTAPLHPSAVPHQTPQLDSS